MSCPVHRACAAKYTWTMDAVRFGRALGLGVKAAGGALKMAAEAAAAPNPRPLRLPEAARGEQPDRRTRSVATGVVQGRAIASGIGQGSRRFGKAVWGPAARAGGVLWYEVTGAFFALFALAAGIEVWHRRRDLLAPFGLPSGTPSGTPSGPREKAWFAVAMLAAFAWFTVSSFVRAHRRARRP